MGQCMCTVVVVCPFAPYGLANGPKPSKSGTNGGSRFVECIFLKLLDGFASFKVIWKYLDLCWATL